MDKNKQKSYSDKEVKSIKVALFFIAAVLIFYLGSVFLKGINVFGKKNYYYAVFEDVGALHESTNVALNGYEIGKVTGIKLLSSNPVRICAEILVTEDLDIPEDSKLEVAQKDVLGGMIVNLHLGQSSKMAHRGDTLGCYLAGGMLDGVGDLVTQLQSVVASVDTIGQNLKLAFRTEDSLNGGTMIKNTLENLEHATADLSKLLADNGGKVNNFVSQLDKLSKTLADASPKINEIVDNVDNISDSIAQSNIRGFVNEAKGTIDNVNRIVSEVERGEGTLGQLVRNDSLYNSINKTIESLDVLIKDLKENPSKYINVTVFGKRKKKNKE
ncbi:MAG: MlaD family protein [Bacteroidales bacterium]|nr:MlaD family protein [Bacteroidales bacterium]